MSAGKQTEADQIIIQSGVKVQMPKRKISQQVEQGMSPEVDLSPNEYNELLQIANDPAGLNLQQHVVDIAQDISSLPLYQQQSIIRNVFDVTFNKAKKILLNSSPEIQQRIKDRAEIIRDVGQGAK
jgi:hypothetical protein